MISKVLCFLAICLLQVYANHHDWSYCTCMKNEAAAKKAYEDRHDKYFAGVKDKQDQWKAAIKDRVNEMHTKNECHNTYYTKNDDQFTWEMLALCGGHALGTTYDAPWVNDKSMQKEQVCGFIATMAPIMCEYIDLNESVLPNCEVSNTFDKTIWPNYEGCAKQCKGQ